jgi:hypothetical protein
VYQPDDHGWTKTDSIEQNGTAIQVNLSQALPKRFLSSTPPTPQDESSTTYTPDAGGMPAETESVGDWLWNCDLRSNGWLNISNRGLNTL